MGGRDATVLLNSDGFEPSVRAATTAVRRLPSPAAACAAVALPPSHVCVRTTHTERRCVGMARWSSLVRPCPLVPPRPPLPPPLPPPACRRCRFRCCCRRASVATPSPLPSVPLSSPLLPPTALFVDPARSDHHPLRRHDPDLRERRPRCTSHAGGDQTKFQHTPRWQRRGSRPRRGNWRGRQRGGTHGGRAWARVMYAAARSNE